MKYLYSPAGITLLEKYLAEDTLLAFDFDGTLAPIVTDPAKASLRRSTALLLTHLALQAPVALISGRKLADLKSRSQVNALAWIGNHGMEGLPGWGEHAKSTAATVNNWFEQLREPLLRWPGLVIEDKIYSLTAHYRQLPFSAEDLRRLYSIVASLRPAPRLLPGKCVINLLVPGHPHKGDAVKALLAGNGFDRAIFLGDDDTDEDVFRLQDPRILSIRVGHKKKSRANAYLETQGEIDSLLRILLSRHSH